MMKVKFIAKKMSAIDQTLLPALLFLVYFFLTIQFLPQSSTATISDRPTIVEEQANRIVEISEVKASTNDLEAPVISRDWLETQSLANLKAIAAELCITPIGDKRSKLTWINAIVTTTPENTVLAVNICYA
jgi:hypothetical protein